MKKITRFFIIVVVLLTTISFTANAQYCEDMGQVVSDNSRGWGATEFTALDVATNVDVTIDGSGVLTAGDMYRGVANDGNPVTIYAGNELQIVLKKAPSFNWVHFAVYADWNGDEVFDPVSEKVHFDNTNANADRTYTINVPTDATIGQTRIRIIMGWFLQDTDETGDYYYSPCKVVGDETEGGPEKKPKNARAFDFLVDVKKAELATERTVTVVSSDMLKGSAVITGTTDTSVTTKDLAVSVTATANAGYFFEKWTNTDTGVDVGTSNPYVYTGETDLNLTANFIEGFYRPMSRYYAAPNPVNQQADRYITDAAVIIGGIETAIVSGVTENPNPLPEGTTPNQTVDGGVVDYTATKINLIVGATSFDLKMTGKESGDGLQWTQQNVFIDWNNDFDFIDEGEAGTPTGDMPNNELNSAEGYTRTITIPEGKGVADATYRMRVIYNEESGDWASTIWSRNSMKNGVAYDFEIKFVSVGTRTVTVATADAAKGSVAINGTDQLSITTDQAVTVQATPAAGYVFDKWTNASDNSEISTANPFTYTESTNLNLVADFLLQPPTVSVPSNSTIVKDDIVTINSADGTTIKYTTDGTNPATSETATTVVSNTAPVSIATDLTLKAIAIKGAETTAQIMADYSVVNITLGEYYYLKFQRTQEAAGSKIAISDQGEDATLKAEKFALGTESQRWKIEKGSKDGVYKFTGTSGSVIYYSDRYKAATTATETDMRILKTINTTYSGWEIQRVASTSMAMNPFGGAYIGREIGEWNTGSPSNVLVFATAKNVLAERIAQADATHNAAKAATQFGGYTDAEKINLQDAINNAQTIYDNTAATETEIIAAIAQIETDMATFRGTQNNDLNLLLSSDPKKHRWFSIRSASTHSYITNKVISAEGRNTDDQYTFVDKADPVTDEQLFRFELSDDKTSIVNIINKANGTYMKQDGAIGADATSNSGTFTMVPLTDGLSFNIQPSSTNAIHGQENGLKIVNWAGSTGSASAWIVDFESDVLTAINNTIPSQYVIIIDNGIITVQGVETFDVYSVSGVKVNKTKRLQKGVYVVKTNDFAQKVVVQ